MTDRLITAVDPGKFCGVAIFFPGRGTPTVRRLSGDQLPEVASIVASVRKAADEHKVKATIVIENQFGKVRRNQDGKETINIKALQTLMRRRHEWEILAEVYGIQTTTVYPVTWQTILNQVPKLNSDGSKRTTKARSLQLAARKFPKIYDWTEDTADAANIGEWYRFKLMSESAPF